MTLATLPGAVDVISAPGLIYYNTTSLSAEANYGTLLGLLDGPVTITPRESVRDTRAEPFGEEPVQRWLTGRYWELSFRVHAKRAAAYFAGFPVGNSSARVDIGGSVPIGTPMVSTTYCKRWLFMPLDETSVNPCVFFQFGQARINGPYQMGSDNDVIFPILVTSFRCPGNLTHAQAHGAMGAKGDISVLTPS